MLFNRRVRLCGIGRHKWEEVGREYMVGSNELRIEYSCRYCEKGKIVKKWGVRSGGY